MFKNYKIPYIHTSLKIFYLNGLHFLNDGFEASFLLLLPFIAKDMHITLTEVGSLGTVTNIFRVLLAFPAGYVATKYGGFKVLIIAMFFCGLGYLGAGFAPSFLSLFPMFILGGIGFGLFHPIGFALTARWSTKLSRGKEMGNFTAIGDLGRICISTILTFIVIYIGWRFTSILYALIAIIISTILYFFFLSKNSDIFRSKQIPVKNVAFLDILRFRKFIFAVLATMLDTLASSSLFIFLPFLLLKHGISSSMLGAFIAAYFFGNFAGKTILGKFVDIFGHVKIFILSELLMAFFIYILANSNIFIITVICTIVLGLFTKGTVPVAQIMVSESAEHHGNFEKAFGINSLFASIAVALSPLLLGFISDKMGIIMAFNVMAIIAIFAIIPALAFRLLKLDIQ